MNLKGFIEFSSNAVNVSGLPFAKQIPFHWKNRKKDLTEQEKDLIDSFIQKRFSKTGFLSYTKREFIRDHAECHTRRKNYTIYISSNNHLVFTSDNERKAFKISA